MAALPIMAGASIISSLIGGLLGGKTANEQAAGAINAANASNSIRDNQYQLSRSDLSPYTQAGANAVARLQGLLGIGPKPGAVTGPASLSLPQDAVDKQNKAAFLQAWLDGKNPVGADGKNIGSAPSNPATRAKVQGELDQLNRDVMTAKEMAQNQVDQTNATNSLDPSQYGSLMKDFTNQDFVKDPGYDFRMQEGAKAMERSAAARGGVQSGGTLKALDRYNQDFASNEFNNAYNRFQTNKATDYNFLAGTAGLGQVSAGQVANLGANTASQNANSTAQGITDAANARASSYTNWANALSGGAQNLIGLYANRNNIQNGTGFGMPSYGGTPPFLGTSVTNAPRSSGGIGVYN